MCDVKVEERMAGRDANFFLTINGEQIVEYPSFRFRVRGPAPYLARVFKNPTNETREEPLRPVKVVEAARPQPLPHPFLFQTGDRITLTGLYLSTVTSVNMLLPNGTTIS